MTGGSLRCLPDWEATLRWSEYQSLISQALDRSQGEWLAEDIREALDKKLMQLWVSDNALAVTQINKYPRKTYCEILLAASNKHMGQEFWRGMIIHVTEWAKQNKCDAIRTHGRRGWGKVMGWEEIYTVIETGI